MDRRTWLGAGVAVAAGTLGAWWSGRQRPGVGSDEVLAAPTALWDSRFTALQGGELAMASLRGRPLVLNFWATWCPPCVREMPELDRFAAAQGNAGWRVLGLAIDQAPAVRQFLDRTPVRFPIALAGDQGLRWVRELGNPAGGLPFTVVFDAQGRIVHRKLGATSHDELSGWAAAAKT